MVEKLIFVLLILIVSIKFLKCYIPPKDPIDRKFCKCENIHPEARIFDGTKASAPDLQYVAIIFTKKAHCKDKFLYFQANGQISYVGAGLEHQNEEIFKTEANYRVIQLFHIHPDYQFIKENNETIHDIGLIETDKPFEFGLKTNIYPACMFLYDFEKVKNYKNKVMIIAGYGTQSSVKKYSDDQSSTTTSIKTDQNLTDIESMTYAKIRQTDEVCKEKHYPNTICLLEKDTGMCPDDLGGPVLTYSNSNKKLYVVAVHHNVISGKDAKYICDKEVVSTATLIFSYLDWIDKLLNGEICRRNGGLIYAGTNFTSYEKNEYKETIISGICLFAVVAMLTFYAATLFKNKVRGQLKSEQFMQEELQSEIQGSNDGQDVEESLEDVKSNPNLNVSNPQKAI